MPDGDLMLTLYTRGEQYRGRFLTVSSTALEVTPEMLRRGPRRRLRNIWKRRMP